MEKENPSPAPSQKTSERSSARTSGASPKRPSTPRFDSFAGLQHTLGNQAMLSLMNSPRIQSNSRSDATKQFEAEADRAAETESAVSTIKRVLFQRGEHSSDTSADPHAVRSHLGSGRSLDPGSRSRLESAFGEDFSGVRVHTDSRANNISSRLNARALTVGNDIAFAPGEYNPGTIDGDALLAHELAHVVQQSTAATNRSYRGRFTASEDALENDANASAFSATAALGRSAEALRSFVRSARPRLASGIQLQRCSSKKKLDPDAKDALEGKKPWTAPLARNALDYYRDLSQADRAALFAAGFPPGRIQSMLAVLPAADAGGDYNDVVQDILRRVQRAGALESAKSSGLADESAMVHAQGTFMEAKNRAASQAALPVGVAPTTAQVAAQQSSQVAQGSIAPSTSTLTPAQVTAWTTRANTAITTVVAYAMGHFPGLGLTAADFKVDIVGVENRGAGVIAYGDKVGGRRVATVGRTFVRFAEKDPAYAMSAVYHELHGHPEYGPYGQPGTEYGLELYDKAAALMPGYVQPSGQGRTSELDNFAYQETEIYSLLRSIPYHKNLAPADAAMQPSYVDPEPTVKDRISEIKKAWEPKVAKALLRGLYMRLRNDPTISKAELAAFERGVNANFTGADAATAKDILK